MTQSHRTKSGGRIDRSRTILFRFDSRTYQGHPGDTLASALLANGVRLMARSFKYHRPRGLYTAGPEEPNVLVELRDGARREPNTRATTVELYDGLSASSQNRWPSLKRDVSAINDRAAKLLPAGFYYKTFMWPPAAWESVYEPVIRRMAGLGRAVKAPDPDAYEHTHAFCDVLVVGSGAAGLNAALAAGRTGARVMLLEQDFELGGGLLLDPAFEAYRAVAIAQLQALPEVQLLPRTTVVGYYEHNVLGAVERVADHLKEPEPDGVRQRFWTIRAREVVLACGAIERLIAFPGNDIPGVMLSSAALAYVTRFGALPGRRAVVFTNNDLGVDNAIALSRGGVAISAIVDVRAKSEAATRAFDANIEVLGASEIVGVAGRHGVQAVTIRRRDTVGSRTIEADLLCVSGGFNPTIHLSAHTRAKARFEPGLAAFIPGEPRQAEYSAGAGRGVFGSNAAALDGRQAGVKAAQSAGFEAKTPAILPDLPPDPPVTPIEAFWEVNAPGKAFVDLQNDVTADDLRLAHREGYGDVEHAKRYTTHGMGTDQGKTGGLVGVAVLAKARGETIQDVGVPTFRPYVTPVTWGALAGSEVGPHFMPTRRSPLHAWQESQGAVFMETGLWHRPAYFTTKAETGWAPIQREARAVREAVGLCDVSTLGKIDVQGADSGQFLDLLYANTASTVALGKVRYGLMLREDGIIFDDGTIARLGPQHFLITTTTAKAADVLEHMERHAQTVWPELDVTLASVSDQWAQIAIAGPRSRATLEACLRGLDISNAKFPFMSHGEGSIDGAPVRIFRVSFSGELAFEVATPAGFGERVANALMSAGQTHGIVNYGLEALNLLRVEKGHVTGAELNGQTTARDLGFAKLLKKKGDFIGRTLTERPALIDPSRPSLVGIRALGSGMEPRLRAGAHIVNGPAGQESLGHVTSVTPSVVLERWIGLALLKSGPERIGKRLYATFPLKNEAVEVEICSPHHVDPENARVKA